MENATELQVHMLGEFTLTYGSQTIADQHSRSGKLWSLLEYIVAFHTKEISQTELIELLWADDETIQDPSNTLKTLLHRVRAQLAILEPDLLRSAISYHRGSYRWAPTVPCRIDVDDFDNLCKAAETEDDENAKLKMILEAIALYKGDFLSRSALEPWVMPINVYHRTQYLKIVYQALDLLSQRGEFTQALEICQKAVTIDPYDEGLHLHMIKCLLATGSQRAALQHYKHVTDLFFSQFGVSPSEELTTLYREVVQTDRDMELDLNIIKESLQEADADNRAYSCEYEFFKEFYRLSARSAFRTGQVIHIALITITPSKGEPFTQKQTNSIMERLETVISTSLRRNDVIARYSVTQYLLMLPSASFENAQMILNRIVTAYRSQYPKMAVTLQYKILPLDPLLPNT